MKKSTLKNGYIGLFLLFFVVGAFWGKFFYYSEDNRNVLFRSKTLTILTEENFLPQDIIESFAIEKGINVNIVHYFSKTDLRDKISQPNIDLVAFKSYHASDILARLSPIEYSEISNKDSVSVDFRNPRYDPENKLAIPLFWGVTKDKNVEKSILWVDSIGISKDSIERNNSHKFLDYILQEEIAAVVVHQKKVASTNRNLESNKNVESKWKPSYLRKISIRDLVFADKASF